MHSMEVARSTIPGFITKLWNIVEDPATSDLISWSSSGGSFIIHNQVRFAVELLPKYFKHSNMASFIRQLNMYGFRKVVNVDIKHKGEGEDLEFYHPFFCLGEDHLLEFIKRKPTVGRGQQGQVLDTESQTTLKEMLEDMQMLHGKQESVTQQLANMQKENASLWKEVHTLRAKHEQQQLMVNQLIQFFFGFLQKSVKPLQLKRKVPSLMGKNAKLIKLDSSANGAKQVQSPLKEAAQATEATVVSDGPVIIHEIPDSDTSLPTELMTDDASPKGLEISDLSPEESTEMDLIPSTSLNTPHWSPSSTPLRITPLDSPPPVLPLRPLKKLTNNLESHIEGTQEELNWLHDQIKDSHVEKEIEDIFKHLLGNGSTTQALTTADDPPLSVASPHSLKAEVAPSCIQKQCSAEGKSPSSPKNFLAGKEVARYELTPPPVELGVPVTPLDFESLLDIDQTDEF